MKLTPQLITEMEAWIRENGIFPDPCGASIKSFCERFGIDDQTYRNWQEKSDFSAALSRAREYFKTNTVQEVSNALIKAAKGVDFTAINEEARSQKIKERDPKTGKVVKEYDGPAVIVKSSRKTIYYPPNVEAAKFVLANLAPDRWRMKQEIVHEGGERPLELNLRDPKALAGLQKAITTGAMPRKPEDEDED